MKFLLSTALFACFTLSANAQEGYGWDKGDLVNAVNEVEAGGATEDVPAGDDGAAIGPLQIHWACWKDATDYDDTIGGAYSDCENWEYAKKIFDAYMRRYAGGAYNDELSEDNVKYCAKIWNGGPDGNDPTKQNPALDRYAQAVVDALGPAPYVD